MVALLNYPEVIQMMSEDLDLTMRWGEPVSSHETYAMNVISAFREVAYAAGNLQSEKYQTVENEQEVIITRQVGEKIVSVLY